MRHGDLRFAAHGHLLGSRHWLRHWNGSRDLAARRHGLRNRNGNWDWLRDFCRLAHWHRLGNRHWLRDGLSHWDRLRRNGRWGAHRSLCGVVIEIVFVVRGEKLIFVGHEDNYY